MKRDADRAVSLLKKLHHNDSRSSFTDDDDRIKSIENPLEYLPTLESFMGSFHGAYGYHMGIIVSCGALRRILGETIGKWRFTPLEP